MFRKGEGWLGLAGVLGVGFLITGSPHFLVPAMITGWLGWGIRKKALSASETGERVGGGSGGGRKGD